MIDTSSSTPELFAALAKAQAGVENASKTSTNPHFRSSYADLAEVLNTVRPVFASHGISIVQATGFDGATVSVTTLLAHASGGHISSTASCVPAKSDAQAIGSATTYLRRYSLAAMAGIAQEDDDGNSAAHSGKPAPAAKPDPRVGDFTARLTGCAELGELEAIGGELARSGIKGADLDTLRKLYASRRRALVQADDAANAAPHPEGSQ